MRVAPIVCCSSMTMHAFASTNPQSWNASAIYCPSQEGSLCELVPSCPRAPGMVDIALVDLQPARREWRRDRARCASGQPEGQIIVTDGRHGQADHAGRSKRGRSVSSARPCNPSRSLTPSGGVHAARRCSQSQQIVDLLVWLGTSGSGAGGARTLSALTSRSGRYWQPRGRPGQPGDRRAALHQPGHRTDACRQGDRETGVDSRCKPRSSPSGMALDHLVDPSAAGRIKPATRSGRHP